MKTRGTPWFAVLAGSLCLALAWPVLAQTRNLQVGSAAEVAPQAEPLVILDLILLTCPKEIKINMLLMN